MSETSNLKGQYSDRWSPGDANNQVISSPDTDEDCLEYGRLNTGSSNLHVPLSTLRQFSPPPPQFPEIIFRSIFVNEIVVFWLKFHQSFFWGLQSTISQHLFRLWLGADQVTSHYPNQWFDYQCLYASLGLNELNSFIQSNRAIVSKCTKR